MSDTALVLFEDEGWRSLRPLADLVVTPALAFGAGTLASRWLARTGLPLHAIAARPEVAAASAGLPAVAAAAPHPGDTWLAVNAAARPGPWFDAVRAEAAPGVFVAHGRVAAARAPAAGVAAALARGAAFAADLRGLGLTEQPVAAEFLAEAWQLFELNPAAILEDLEHVRGAVRGAVHRLAALEHPERITIEPGAEIGPFAVLDAREGPILVGGGARIAPHTIVTGPCVIGPGTHLLGGSVGGSTFGPQCRIAGEVEACVWQGHGNKRHHGFVGHSAFGEWVNLGALTTTSDLKNNYGEVRVTVDGRERATGSRKVGALVGSHVKTGIGTLLPTGAVVGTGSNLFGGGQFAPRVVPSFSWWNGERFVTHELEACIRTARLAFSRRDRTFGAADEQALRALHAATVAERHAFAAAGGG